MQRAIAELQIVINDQVLDFLDLERDSYSDADSANGQQLHHPIHSYRPLRANPLERREPDHLWPVEKQVARTAFTRIDHKLRNGLPEQFANRLSSHLVRDVEGIYVDYFASISFDRKRRHLPFGESFGLVHRRDHNRTNLR